MTALQIILTVPFLVLWGYTAFNVFDTFRLMLYKGQIGDDVKRKRRKRLRIILIAMMIYVVFAIFVFMINHFLTAGR